MTTEIILAGFGGQGILFAGKILAYCALMDNREISWLPSYGPEMRGGTANCSVCISDEPIGSPVVTNPDCLIAMNDPSYKKFIQAVKPNGLVLLDNSIVDEVCERKDITEISLPATDLATNAGLNGAANMVLLGRMLAETKMFSLETVQKAMEKCIPPKRAHLIAANMKAIELGMAQK
ncbi:2-oxoacid:acceptor oxidoreductase family protein [uncultured Ruminococcus sp.]|uniref:2-oxoacid:acceptor oxidoreductase family protein n=1 Tax=uncultured Ruminococcus sp. TaxID=165186 RepID=UPI00265841CC|nr:2-oxoacid:acceptor oxidoreductase family protein [uncultured Ruminococcus sp.]